MPIVYGDAAGSAPKPPKKKKPTRVVHPPSPGDTNFIGPVIPKSPVRSSPTPTYDLAPKGPTHSSPNPVKPVYTPPPVYNRPAIPKPAPKIADAQALKGTALSDIIRDARRRVSGGSTSSGDLSDFLQGPSTAGRGISDPEGIRGPEGLQYLLSDRLTEKPDVVGKPESAEKIEGRRAFKYLLDTTRDDAVAPEETRQALMDFLSTIRPENYDPEYGGPVMPERLKHRRGDVNAPLRQHWDQDYINSLLEDTEGGFPSERVSVMNSIIYDQLKQQENWAKKRTSQRAYDLNEVLGEASQEAYEGNFDFLEKKLEKNPDLLEFNSYVKDYTRNSADVLREWEKIRNSIKDPYMRTALAKRVRLQIQHYNKVREYYATARKVSREAIEKYEKKYNESVEFHDEDNAGPAIPVMDKEEKERQKITDLVGEFGDDQATWSEFYSGAKGKRSVIKQQRHAIKRRLKVKDLPTVKEMLAVKVSQGELDPRNDAEVEAWISRFQNPNHPDTRAMYFGFASAVNKRLDPKKDGLPFINGPTHKLIKSEKERAKGNLEAEKLRGKDEYDLYHHESFLEGTGDIVEGYTEQLSRGLAAPFKGVKNAITGDDRSLSGLTGAKSVNELNSTGAVGWTIDKLSRFNYALASTIDAWNSLDKDPGHGSSWVDNIFTADVFGMLQGQSMSESFDEVFSDPGKLKGVANAGYQQLFRGSGLPGTSKDTTPVLFGQVIAHNGLRDNEDNLYDKSWYHHIAGFVLDAGTDPLNFVGVGVVDDVLKIPKRLTQEASLADEAVGPSIVSTEFLDDVLSGSRGPAADKAYHVQQALARLGDESDFGVPTVADQKIIPYQFSVETMKDAPYVTRAHEAPSVVIPRFTENFTADRRAMDQQLKELDALKESTSYNTALSHYETELRTLGEELSFAPIILPELRVQKLMARTATKIKTQGVSAELHFDNLGGKFWQRILKPLEEGDIIRAWPEHTSETKFATITDPNGTERLTSRAARAKAAMEAQEKNYDTAMRIGVDPNIAPELSASWERAIDEGYDIDEVTGKPSVWEEYDVDSYINAGAPGLLDSGFDPVKEFADAAHIPVDDFKKVFSQKDILRALYHGPRMLEESDDVAKQLVIEARTRIRDSKAKLKAAKRADERVLAYKALSNGYTLASQHVLAGAIRYLDTLQGLRRTGSALDVPATKISHLDDVISEASAKMEDEFGEVDDLGDYIGGFEGTLPTRNGTYENFDFEGKTLKQIVEEQGVENFSSRSKQYEAIIEEATRQKHELISKSDLSDLKPTSLTPAEAYDVNRLLPENSIFLRSDGSINIEKVSEHLKTETVFDDSTKNFTATLKVRYTLSRPVPPKGMSREAFERTSTWAHYQRENAFLDNLSKFIESRASSLYRSEKTKVVREKFAKGSSKSGNDTIDEFWREVGGRKMGPAERKLGPRPKAGDLNKRLPNYTQRKIKSDSESEYYAEIRKLDEETEAAQRKIDAAADNIDPQNYKLATDNLSLKYEMAVNRLRNKYKIPPESKTILAKDGELDFDSVTVTEVTGKRTKGQKNIAENLETLKRGWDAAVKRAREIDQANYNDLLKSNSKITEGYKLTVDEIKMVYKRSFDRAFNESVDDLNRGIIRQTPANARLPVGDVTRQLEKQMEAELRYQNLQLKIQEIQASNAEEILAVKARKNELIKKRRQMYGNIKRIRMETNIIHKTMVKRISEDQILQVASSPATLTGPMIQVRLMGMKKNLQFSNNLFKGAEKAAQIVPLSIRNNFADVFVRPTKQFSRATKQEMIRLRAQHESKTPVIIHANLQNLTSAFRNLTEAERKAMAHAIEKGIPYGGKAKGGFAAVKAEMDDIMRIINGSHDNYIFKKSPNDVTGEALTLWEIGRYLPEGYYFDPKVLFRVASLRKANNPTVNKTAWGRQAVGTEDEWRQISEQLGSGNWIADKPPTPSQLEAIKNYGGDPEVVNNTMSKQEASDYIDHLKNQANRQTDRTDPFSPIPEARSEFTYGDLLEAIRANGSPNPKDLEDPFRVSWVMRLAADQAAQIRALKHSVGETFGVRLPSDPIKHQVVMKLKSKHGWEGIQDVPGYLFPPESYSDIQKLMKMTKPGKEAWEISKMFDQAMGYWKQGMTIYNPAYYTRNGIGEMMVSWLDGVNHPKWYRMSYRVNRYLKKTDTDLADLLKRFDSLEGTVPVDVAKANEILFSLKGGYKVRIEDVLYWYTNTGMKSTFANTDLGVGVRGLANQSLQSGRVRGKIAGANNAVHEAGEGFEDYLRMAHFIHAMQNSGKGTLKEAAEYAATRVTRSHFDYTDFSKFEKVSMLRAFPFFKWVRRGAPLMLAHLFMTPGKMAALPKALNAVSNVGFDPINLRNDDPVLSTSDILEDDNGHLPNYSGIAPGWVRDLFAYAMQPTDDDEYANFFRITTPQIDGLSGGLNFIQNYKDKGIIGGLADTTAYPLLNPLIKSAVELGQNEGLDPDFKHPIYGGDYNESKGINPAEAIGAYAARQLSPHLAFLSKLSSRGKLPDALNITDDDYEHNSDAFRDVISFITGVGFYQGKQEALPEPTTTDSVSSDGTSNNPAVGLYRLSDLSMFSGRAGHKDRKSSGNGPLTGNLLGNIASSNNKSSDHASGWIEGLFDNKKSGWIEGLFDNKKSGWIPNKYGSSGGRGGYSGYGGYSGGSSGSSGPLGDGELLALLRKLKEMVDQGVVIDPERFKQ